MTVELPWFRRDLNHPVFQARGTRVAHPFASGTRNAASYPPPAEAENDLGLSGSVPAHKIPSAIVLRPGLSRSYTAPDSAAERRVARVWQQLLTLDRVGFHDNFFDLGGNSIRLPAVLAALQKHPEYQDFITQTDRPGAAATAGPHCTSSVPGRARRDDDRGSRTARP